MKTWPGKGRFFVLHIDRPQVFDLSAFAAFLRADITAEARRIVREWRPVDDLAHIRVAAGNPLENVVEPPLTMEGVARSRTMRSLWLAGKMGLEYPPATKQMLLEP